jgi:hypothetical protein
MIPPDLKDAASSVSLKNLAQELIHFIQVLHTLSSHGNRYGS